MPEDEWMLSQGTVDFRNEERRARMFACSYDDIDESAGMAEMAFCTCDADCQADADQHMENCPVEHQLREEMGF